MECRFSIPKKDKKAIWEITNQCNYLCKYCIFASNAHKDCNELSLDECKHVIDELVKNKFYTLKITGGEPFLRKDLLDIIRYAKEKQMRVDVSTNASLIDNTKAGSLKKTNIDMVHVSLDGYNIDTQEYIRGKNTFNRTIRGIKLLKDNDLYVRIGTVIYKNNENNIEDIIKFVINLNVNEIIFSIMEPVGRLYGDYTEYKTKTNEELKKELDYLKEKYQPKIIINYNWDDRRLTHVKSCPAGKKFIFINNLGDASPCTWINNFKTKYNLKTTSLESILKSCEIKKYLENKACAYKG